MNMTRREALRNIALTSVAVTALPRIASAETAPAAQPPAVPAPASGPFVLPPLPYAVDALEPHIDAQTMEIHHGKHHATYVKNLNAALAGKPDLAAKNVEDLVRDWAKLPEDVRTAVRNNGGGHYNHSLFWTSLTKDGGKLPAGDFTKAMDEAFGGLDGFKTQMTKAALGVFGSGWAWLCLGRGAKLEIRGIPNQDSPLADGAIPLLGLDVWEHAYYLKYQNRRADYIAAIYNVLDWDTVASRFQKALAG